MTSNCEEYHKRLAGQKHNNWTYLLITFFVQTLEKRKVFSWLYLIMRKWLDFSGKCKRSRWEIVSRQMQPIGVRNEVSNDNSLCLALKSPSTRPTDHHQAMQHSISESLVRIAGTSIILPSLISCCWIFHEVFNLFSTSFFTCRGSYW